VSVRVKLESHCVFDIGERTLERRMLIKEYVKAISRILAVYAGRPPGSVSSADDPTSHCWVDGDWRIGYTITQSSGVTLMTIHRIELTGG
jgi:hypothetical protein